jgi:acetyl-CoA decarbonylase/synthase complex subunit gamma
MSELALSFDCPLVVYAPNNLSLLKSLTKTLVACGVADIVLDPGTFPSSGLSETVHNFTLIRKAACNKGDKLMGYPILGVPMASWIGNVKAAEDILRWREAYLAAMLMVRYADLLILHGIAGWSLLPLVVLRQNLYTDPRKPVAVEPGLRVFGNPNEASPILFTTNFALTYHTVASDLEKANVNAYLLVVDTEGIAVDSAVAGRKLTADKVANALKKSEIESKVKHKKLVIPGKAARLASEIEELSGWQVLIGPKDSSGIPKFLEEKWKNTIEHR